jgi:MerR family mercuric resistance operon transcriptional regulator
VAKELTIGRVAELAGVNVETVRYYHRRGLLEEPLKPQRGHRRYPAEAVQHIRFIKRAQALGFTLEEVAALMTLEEACDCAETRALAAHKVEMIDQKLSDLSAMRAALAGLIRQCDAGEPAQGCPIIQVLLQDDSP